MAGVSMWDRRYSSKSFVYGREPNDFLVAVHAKMARGRVLCIAEGEGRNATFLASRGHDVTAVDFSVVGLKKTLHLAGECNVHVTTVHADLQEFDFGYEQWDSVVSIFCHLPPEVRRSVHSRIVVGLKESGLLVLEAYTPRQLQFGTGGPSDADLLVTLEDLRNELTGLEVLIGQEVDREMSEGGLHRGSSAVVQYLARKTVSRTSPSQRPTAEVDRSESTQ